MSEQLFFGCSEIGDWAWAGGDSQLNLGVSYFPVVYAVAVTTLGKCPVSAQAVFIEKLLFFFYQGPLLASLRLAAC